MIARVGVVTKALKAFGIEDPERIKAIVDLTIGIPWLVPPTRGEDNPPALLFAAAVTRAALGKTFGAPGPGDILQAAIDIAGRVRSDQGHESMRKWVGEAMDPAKALGVPREKLIEVGMGGQPMRVIRGGGAA